MAEIDQWSCLETYLARYLCLLLLGWIFYLRQKTEVGNGAEIQTWILFCEKEKEQDLTVPKRVQNRFAYNFLLGVLLYYLLHCTLKCKCAGKLKNVEGYLHREQRGSFAVLSSLKKI